MAMVLLFMLLEIHSGEKNLIAFPALEPMVLELVLVASHLALKDVIAILARKRVNGGMDA